MKSNIELTQATAMASKELRQDPRRNQHSKYPRLDLPQQVVERPIQPIKVRHNSMEEVHTAGT